MAGIFDLHADTAALSAVAGAWTDLQTSVRAAAERVMANSASRAGWDGTAAESYDNHRKQLTDSLDEAAATAGRVASALHLATSSITLAQDHLDAVWSGVAGVRHTGGDDLLFLPQDDGERARVVQALADAKEIRHRLDVTLARDLDRLQAAARSWAEISDRWAGVSAGTKRAWDVPVDQGGVGILTNGSRTYINTGPGDDQVKVFTDPRTGETIVQVNGQVYRLPAGQHVVVRTGEGNDTISVPADSRLSLTIDAGGGDDDVRAGAGDDTVLGLGGRDKVYGGEGSDRISTGADRDYADGQGGNDIVETGLGDDTAYGLGGDDRLSGGEGQDYLEGGDGNDDLRGGDGNDILSGGTGDDVVRGQGGDDVSYAGSGQDTAYGGGGHDTSYSELGDFDHGTEHDVTVHVNGVPDFIKIEGSPDFVARIRADLEMMGASPTGQKMLESLQEAHDHSGVVGLFKNSLTISEYHSASDPYNSSASHLGNANEIHINPALDSIRTPGGVVDGPPSVVLYHEMAHVYDYMHDTSASGDYDHGPDAGIPNSEREAAGLPIDDDHDPRTPEQIDPDHPYEYTENGLREEMGAPHRDYY